MNESVEDKTRIMGLDIGTKRTGVALSDESLFLSSPLTTIETGKRMAWVTQVCSLVEEGEVAQIVVGLPLNHHGEIGNDALNIRKYIAVLRDRVSIPVIEWDERFTTVQAERTLVSADFSRKKRKLVIDQVAATIILQSYLDSLRFREDTT